MICRKITNDLGRSFTLITHDKSTSEIITKVKITGDGTSMAKTYRLRDDLVEALNARRIKLIVERKEDVKESDMIGALIWKHLNALTADDVKRYREQVLGKD